MIKLVSLRAAKFKQLDDVAIAFPQRGSVLIQGLNEAGKSTLFESVFFALFGKGLVTEDNSGKLDDLINYQAPRALVKLAFTTDDATFTVSRSLNRGKPNTAVLDVEYVDGKAETITNLSAINRRVVEELRLDGEALLNSCFVEQKKLEKLEGMSAQQRRDTLLRLLNLDKLSLLEAKYKPSSADEFQLEQLRSRVKLAEVQRDFPQAEQRLSEVEVQQCVIAALRLRRQIAAETESAERELHEQVAVRQAAGELARQLQDIEQLKQLRDQARATGEGLRAIDEAAEEIDQLAGDIELAQSQADRAPDLDAEVRRLEQRASELAEHARDRRSAELLRGWLQIREVAAIAQESEQQLEHLRQDVAALEGTAAKQRAERARQQRLSAGGAGAALLVFLASVTLGVFWIRLALAFLALAGAAGLWSWRQWCSARSLAVELAALVQQLAKVESEVHRREGEQGLAQRTGQDPARLVAIEEELVGLGKAVPGSVTAAHLLLDEIDEALTRQPAPNMDEQTEAQARELAAAARAAKQAALDAQTRAGELRQALASRQERLSARRAEMESTWLALRKARPRLEQDVEACRALWKELGDQLAALNELELRRRVTEAGQQLGASEQRLRSTHQRLTQLETELGTLVVDEAAVAVAEQTLQAKVPAGDPYPLDDLAATLQQEQHDLLGRIASLRDQRSSLERQLELQNVAVDYTEAERELVAFEEQATIRKQAYRIVTLARKNIVGKVLPSTVRNMGLLLPLLTNDRYRDADIDPETYKIKVWDETAHAMKAKDIFSGGTRDQFSLALRLAFALATLPEELGTAPGFIFLDEPLSSFDHQRGSALVDLLTRGPVAANFEQIFVISHSRSFDESLFDFHIQLDDGRILDSDLPPIETQLPETEQQQLALATVR